MSEKNRQEVFIYSLQAIYKQVVGYEAMSKPKGFYHVVCDAKPDKARNAFCINGYAKAGEDGELDWVKPTIQKSCPGCSNNY
jgi:hypothetical protein